MSVDPDLVIKTANELKEAQERVKTLEARLRNLTQGTVPVSFVLGGERSTPEKVVKLLAENPNTTFVFADILAAIGGNAASLRSLVARMTKEGRIESRGWGKYGAVSEQKERPKAV
jgi:hypothetical protein